MELKKITSQLGSSGSVETGSSERQIVRKTAGSDRKIDRNIDRKSMEVKTWCTRQELNLEPADP
jgi:hypothetical protein